MKKWRDIDKQLGYAKGQIEIARKRIRKKGLDREANWYLIGDCLISAKGHLENADMMARGRKRRY